MQHPDEGTIHAWIDGALPASEAARVEEHAIACLECAERIAEARGLVAASSRIVSALDAAPRGVIPAFGKRTRRFRGRWVGSAIAATLVVAAGTMLTLNGRVDRSTAPVRVADSAAPVPPRAPVAGVAPSAGNQPIAPTSEAPVPRVAATTPTSVKSDQRRAAGASASGTSVVSAAPDQQRTLADVPLSSVGASMAAQRAPAAAPPTSASVASRRDVDQAVGTAAAGGMSKAAAPTGVAGRVATPSMPSARRASARPSAAEPTAAISPANALAGCYELSESVDVIPRRFGLMIAAQPGMPGTVHYVDSTGVIDGRISDVSWAEADRRAVIRTAARGEVLVIDRSSGVPVARSSLGPRTVRTMTCP